MKVCPNPNLFYFVSYFMVVFFCCEINFYDSSKCNDDFIKYTKKHLKDRAQWNTALKKKLNGVRVVFVGWLQSSNFNAFVDKEWNSYVYSLLTTSLHHQLSQEVTNEKAAACLINLITYTCRLFVMTCAMKMCQKQNSLLNLIEIQLFKKNVC